MCTKGCIAFTRDAVNHDVVRGGSVLEVGSLDVNGTVRGIVEGLGPARDVGVDLTAGPGVDVQCSASQLIETFGVRAFDVVISTEMLEHVQDWRVVIHNLKGVLKPGGLLVVTTRSEGFRFHGYPMDFWRYSLDDFR